MLATRKFRVFAAAAPPAPRTPVTYACGTRGDDFVRDCGGPRGGPSTPRSARRDRLRAQGARSLRPRPRSHRFAPISACLNHMTDGAGEGLTDEHVVALCDALETSTSVEELSLNGAPHSTPMYQLDVDNRLGMDAAAALARLIDRNSTITTLRLGGAVSCSLTSHKCRIHCLRCAHYLAGSGTNEDPRQLDRRRRRHCAGAGPYEQYFAPYS